MGAASIAILMPAAMILAVLLTSELPVALMNKRSTREISRVKIGTDGRKAMIEGGMPVAPVPHEVRRISMRTTQREVRPAGDSAPITCDRMRVDVSVEF